MPVYMEDGEEMEDPVRFFTHDFGGTWLKAGPKPFRRQLYDIEEGDVFPRAAADFVKAYDEMNPRLQDGYDAVKEQVGHGDLESGAAIWAALEDRNVVRSKPGWWHKLTTQGTQELDALSKERFGQELKKHMR